MKLGDVTRALHGISQADLNQILRIFGHWPTPDKDFDVPHGCLLAIWFCDYIAALNIVEPSLRMALLQELQPELADVTAEQQAAFVCHLADRRYYYRKTVCLDLQTGQRFEQPPVLHVEKTIFDLTAIFLRRRGGTREQAGD